MSRAALTVLEATLKVIEALGLDDTLRGTAALGAAREELGLEAAVAGTKLRANLQEVATELGLGLGWAPPAAAKEEQATEKGASQGAGEVEVVKRAEEAATKLAAVEKERDDALAAAKQAEEAAAKLAAADKERAASDALTAAAAAPAAALAAAGILGEGTRAGAPRLEAVDAVLRGWRGDWPPSRWEAREELGKGEERDRCVVVGVEDSRIGRIAIKFVRMSKDVRLKREAATMQRAAHENICLCYDYHVR
jgi:hypothetical protein